MKTNSGLAELTGILLGDGSINVYPAINHYRLKITLNANEKEYAEHIQSIFNRLFKENLAIKFRKDENTLDLLCFKRNIIKNLLSLGLVSSPKKDRAIIPEQFMNKELGRHVLRGCFDTDGSVVITNNNGTMYPRLEIKIMRCPMQKQVLALLKMYGFRFKAYQIGGGEVRVQINGKKQAEKWLAEIGFSNDNKRQKLKILERDKRNKKK